MRLWRSLLLSVWLAVVGVAGAEEELFPDTLPQGAALESLTLEWPQMIGLLRVQLQLRDGSMTPAAGVVPLLSDGAGVHQFAFYQPVEGGYRRIGDPVVFIDTARPQLQHLPGMGVHAMRARRVDGKGDMVAYVLRGTVMVEGR